jgi:hypothetical protein
MNRATKGGSFKEGEIMRCNRCGGMMSYEEFIAISGIFFGGDFPE